MDFIKLREKALSDAKTAIRESVCEDNFIIHTINSIEDVTRNINSLTNRLRDWYCIYFPELDNKIEDHEAFVKTVIEANKGELLKEFGLSESMGADIDEKDLAPLISFAAQISQLYTLKEEFKTYLDEVTLVYCKNLNSLLGPLLTAKLIREAGSLKNLAMMHASKVQLLGAEVALFRHLKTGARPPKHGVILQHSLVSGSQRKGRAARVLADKIAILVKTDYFKGEFIADKIREELEEKLK